MTAPKSKPPPAAKKKGRREGTEAERIARVVKQPIPVGKACRRKATRGK